MARLRYTLGAACLVFLVARCACAPAQDDRPQIIEIIAPAGMAQETLDSLDLGEPNYVQSDRNKRTIGVLRELFPELSKLIDQKVKDIAEYLVKTAGPTVLMGLLGGGGLGSLFGGGGGEGGATGTVSGSVNGGFVDADDDSDTETLSSSGKSGSKISISLPTFPPENDNDDDNSASIANKNSKITDTSDNYNDVGLNARFGDSQDGKQSDNKQNDSLNDSKTPGWVEPKNIPGSDSDPSTSISDPNWVEPKNIPGSDSDPSTSISDPNWVEPKNIPGSDSDSRTSKSNPNWNEPKFLSKSTDSKSKKQKVLPKSDSDFTPAENIPDWEEPKQILDDTATSGANAEENNLQGAESQQQEVRVEFDEGLEGDSKVRSVRKSDQEIGASDNNEALDDLTLEDADTSEENRDKRLVSFGFGGGSGASSGGSAGGSGNFLFDIVRRPAEAMARGLGTAFRIITGTDSINLGITATHTSTSDSPIKASNALVAGSGGTEQADESGNASAVADGEAGKGDGYTEGIPGPVTRLFIIANRGISNLIQDLILRIAQTSERLVNFKARLITSII